MMDLNALQQYLSSLGPAFTLRSTDDKLQPDFQAFIATMPGKQINITPGNDGITLQKNVLTIVAATTDAWPVQGLTNVSVTPSAITITINGASSPAVCTGVLQGQMPFSKTVKVPVTVTSLAQTANPWQIGLAQNADNITPMEVILLGNNGGGLPFDIPKGMDFLDVGLTVDKSAYSIVFYPNSKHEAYNQFTLSAKNATWTPVPDIFAFNGLDILGMIKTSSVGVTIVGHILVGSVGIDAGVSMSNSPDWEVFVRPTPPAVAFPGLVALAKWIGGESLNTQVSDGFSSVQIDTGSAFDVAISDVTAGINIKKFSLNYLNITSLLTIGALKLDVLVQLPNLIISGGLHDGVGLKISDLLASLSLPTDAVPQNLTLAKANFSADLRNSVYSINTEVDNLWSVGPIDFDKVTLSLNYNKPDGLTGMFGCQFTIGQTATILVQAGYGGAATGWEFAGGLDPSTTLKIGDVIAMLADKFGIASVPEPIKSLEITELWVAYTTGTGAFEFTCAGNFTVDDTEVDMSVVVKVQKGQSSDPVQQGQVNGSKGYNAFFSGNITIKNLVFDIVFNTNSMSTNVFIASFHNKSTGSVSLHDLVAGVSTKMAQFIPTGLEIDLREVKFIFFEQNKAKQFAFGLEVDVAINLNDLPVVGSKLPSGLEVDINNLQILYASKALNKDQVAIINPLLPSGILALNAAGVAQGLMIEGELVIAGFNLPINTGNKPAPQTTTTTTTTFTGTADPASAGAAPSPITWFNVNKQLGPLSFERIGVEYTNGVLSFALDASLTLGPASLSMMGLSFGSPLNKFEPVFGLQGFAMSIQTPSLELGGAFLKGSTPDGATAYYGQVIARFGTIGIKVLGGDIPEHQADDPNNPGKKITIPASFFLYANVNAPLGGPPYLYLNGFAGGFGINNTLKLPTLENLPGYILLPGPTSKAPAQGSSPKDTIAKVLPQMQKYFIPTPGEYWAAAGIAVSSFEMINAFALVTVSFGVDFQVAVLGTCSMSFPTAATSPIAYVEIDLMASYSTATGLLAIEGIISPASFIFISSCQITGGFAFYVWINPPALSDPNAPKRGDFVVTLGGYHPSFTPPQYYPVVPRLGINLSMGPLHVTGGCYFALTPGMFMAGFAWDATFDISIVKVWFKAGADFLIAWAPFHYEADAYVNLGCSVNLGLFTVNLSIGADLYIWGPPFGGRADVDLDIVSFTISFGADQEPAKPLGWSDFKNKFLPADNKATPAPQQRMMRAARTMDTNDDSSTNVVKASAAKGLLGTNVDGFNWILDPDHFSISVASNVPANQPQWAKDANSWLDISNTPGDYNTVPPPVDPAKWPYLQFSDTVNQMDDKHIWNPLVNIKPMKLNGVTSTLQLTLLKADNDGNFTSYITALTLTPNVLASAGALWGEHTSDKVQLNDPQFQKSCLTGFNITPLPRVPNVVNGVKLILLLYQQANRYYFNYQALAVNPNYKVSSEETDTDNVSHLDITVKDSNGNVLATLPNQGYVLNALVDTWVSNQRSTILANLNSLGFSTSTEVALNNFATQTILTDWPAAMLLADSLVA